MRAANEWTYEARLTHDVDPGGALVPTASASCRLPERREGQTPRRAGCRSRTAQRMWSVGGLRGGVALHGDSARATCLNGKA